MFKDLPHDEFFMEDAWSRIGNGIFNLKRSDNPKTFESLFWRISRLGGWNVCRMEWNENGHMFNPIFWSKDNKVLNRETWFPYKSKMFSVEDLCMWFVYQCFVKQPGSDTDWQKEVVSRYSDGKLVDLFSDSVCELDIKLTLRGV